MRDHILRLNNMQEQIKINKRQQKDKLTKKQKRRNNSEKLKFLKRIKQGYQPSEENESKYIQTTSHKENIKIL